MRYNNTYNRLAVMEMYDWGDEWVIDSKGNLILAEDMHKNNEIPTVTIGPNLDVEDSASRT